MPTIAIAQSTSNVSTSGSVSTLTATLNGVTAGSTLIVSALWDNVAFTAAASDSQTANGNFGSATQFDNGAGSGPNASLWVKQNAEAGTHTVTITITGGNPGIILLLFEEVSGAAATGNPDQHTSFYDSNSNNTTDGTTSGVTSTLNLQPALVYGVCFNAQSTNTPAAGTGFAASLNGTNGVGFAWRTESKRVTATTGIAATFTMSGAASTVISLVVAIDELAGPSITAQPSSTSVYGGGTATFSVSATGTGGLSYQWSRNGSPISGAISSSYTTPALNANDNQSYFTCDVTDSIGTTTSAQAWLTWTAPIVRAVNFVGFLPGFIGEMLTDQAPATPALGQMDWAPGRAQAMGHGYGAGEPLGTVTVAVLRAGGFDQPVAVARAAPRPQVTGGEPNPPRIFTATGFEHVEPSARPQLGPPRHISGEPVPPQVVRGAGIDSSPPAWRRPPPILARGAEVPTPSAFTATGFEHTDPGARPQPGPPRHLAGEPIGAIATVPLQSGGFEQPTAIGRAAPRPIPFGGEPNPPRVFTPTGFEHAEPSARPQMGPPRHLSGDPIPPQVIRGAGIETSPPLWRPSPRFLRFLAGEPSPTSVVTAAGFNVSDALARLPPARVYRAGEPTRTVLVVALSAWGYEPSQPGGRVSRPVRAGLAGDPLPRVIIAAPAGFDPTPAVRRPLPAPIGAAGDVALPGSVASWAWEQASPGARVLRSSMSINGEPLPGAIPAVWFDVPAAAARALRRGPGTFGEPLPPTIIIPAGFEPSPVLFRVTRAVVQIGSEVFSALVLLPPLPVVKVDLSEPPAGAHASISNLRSVATTLAGLPSGAHTSISNLRSVATSMTALRSRTRQSDG